MSAPVKKNKNKQRTNKQRTSITTIFRWNAVYRLGPSTWYLKEASVSASSDWKESHTFTDGLTLWGVSLTDAWIKAWADEFFYSATVREVFQVNRIWITSPVYSLQKKKKPGYGPPHQSALEFSQWDGERLLPQPDKHRESGRRTRWIRVSLKGWITTTSTSMETDGAKS